MDIILLIILFLLLGATLAILYLSLKFKTSGDVVIKFASVNLILSSILALFFS